MNSTDLIFINVTGTNPGSRDRRTISRRFNGDGQEIGDTGTPSISTRTLKNLPGNTSDAAPMPQFPDEEMKQAVLAKDTAAMKAIQVAFADQIDAYEAAQGSTNAHVQLVDSVVNHLVEYDGFLTTDGNGFVVKPENLEVSITNAPNGATVYQVSGTAIFG